MGSFGTTQCVMLFPSSTVLLYRHHNEEVMVQGRQAGQASNPRSYAEIDSQNWGQEAAAVACQATAQQRGGFMQQHFFAPAAQGHFQLQEENRLAQQNKPAAAAVQPALAPPAPVSQQSVEPTSNNSLPGVDMEQVPGPFKIMVGAVMHNLRRT
jgi:hypothetical protein